MGGMDHRLSGFHIFRGVFHRNKSRIVNGNYPVAGKQCLETEESDFSKCEVRIPAPQCFQSNRQGSLCRVFDIPLRPRN